MKYELKQIAPSEGLKIYEMLQEIPALENNMHNNAYGLSYEEYELFISKKYEESQEKEIMDGWKVPSTRYWLYADDNPVGFCDLRHFLTPALENAGGNIGYSIRPCERGKGYGKKMLELLLEKARERGMDKVLITTLSNNNASIATAKANGGVVIKESPERVWISIVL